LIAFYLNQFFIYMQPQPSTPSIAIPVAIVVGFGMIAAAIFFSGNGAVPAKTTGTTVAPETTKETTVRPVDDTDYVRGNPNAPILVIEYSDYDCPFCKNFHETMTRIMEEYGVTGKVGWVYRQFPLEQLHPNAPRISEAAYCAGDLGGSDAYWKFSDLIFSEREVNAPTNMTRLPEFATSAGVDKTKFTECLNSGKFKNKVSDSIAEGAAAGAQGTPYSIVTVGGQQAVINGAQPYPVVKQIIDNLVAQLEGGAGTTN
jgi:protein-disulfide isomerase